MADSSVADLPVNMFCMRLSHLRPKRISVTIVPHAFDITGILIDSGILTPRDRDCLYLMTPIPVDCPRLGGPCSSHWNKSPLKILHFCFRSFLPIIEGFDTMQELPYQQLYPLTCSTRTVRKLELGNDINGSSYLYEASVLFKPLINSYIF